MSSARNAYYPIGVTFVVVDAVAVGLRFWARGLKRAVGYDDIAMALSFVGFIIFVAMELVAIDNGIGATTMEPHFDLVKAAKFFTVAQIVYILTTGVSKLGVALVLFRLAHNANMRYVRITLIVSMVIVGLWCLAVALIYSLQCRPLSVAWGVGTGTCISTTVLGHAGLALSAMDVGVSWLYALLPIYMLRKAQLRLQVKLSIMFLLGLGAVSSVATIIRLKYVIEVTEMAADGGLAAANIIEKTLEGTLYSMLEIGLSILAAALSALRPLLRRLPLFSQFGSSGGNSGPKGSASSKSTSDRERITGPGYRLDNLVTSNGGESQENIIHPKTLGIQKDSRIDVSYETRPITQGGKSKW